MKRFLLFLFAFVFALVNANAQYCTDYYNEPSRNVIFNFKPESAVKILLDTQNGKCKLVHGSNFSVINDNDLTDNTPTTNGRFRIDKGFSVDYNISAHLIDSESGRCWYIYVVLKNDLSIKKLRFELISQDPVD